MKVKLLEFIKRADGAYIAEVGKWKYLVSPYEKNPEKFRAFSNYSEFGKPCSLEKAKTKLQEYFEYEIDHYYFYEGKLKRAGFGGRFNTIRSNDIFGKVLIIEPVDLMKSKECFIYLGEVCGYRYTWHLEKEKCLARCLTSEDCMQYGQKLWDDWIKKYVEIPETQKTPGIHDTLCLVVRSRGEDKAEYYEITAADSLKFTANSVEYDVKDFYYDPHFNHWRKNYSVIEVYNEI